MAAPSYTTDLLIYNSASNNTGWSELTGMTIGAGQDIDIDLAIHASICISQDRIKVGLNSHGFTGTGPTLPPDGVFLIWTKFFAPNSLDTFAAGGQRVAIGSGIGDYYGYYMDGSDTYAYGGWVNYAIDPSTSGSAEQTQGSPGTAFNTVGNGWNVINAISKGNPATTDIIRYGRGQALFTDGDIGNGYATFDGYALVNDDPTVGRFGLFQDVGGSYLWKGLMSLGTGSTAVDFRDSNVDITIDDTFKVSSRFNKIEVTHADSNIEWTGVNIKSLCATSKGDFEMVDDCALNWNTCVFTDMGVWDFHTSASLSAVTFRRTDQVRQSSSLLDNCIVEGSINSSSVVSDVPSSISNTSFTYEIGHALEVTTAGNYVFTGNKFTDYLADDTSGSAIFNNSGGAVTMSIAGGGDLPTYRNGAGASTLILNNVFVTVAGLQDNTEVRVLSGSVYPQIELAGIESATDGVSGNRSFTFSLPAATIVDIVIQSTLYENERLNDYTIPALDASIPISQRFDRNYSNN